MGATSSDRQPYPRVGWESMLNVCGSISPLEPRWKSCGQVVCVCINMCTYARVCVFVGLSGEPGQSVRCGNGGFKDKRCGEFPGCLLPTSQPFSPTRPKEKQTGTQAESWIEKDRLNQEGCCPTWWGRVRQSERRPGAPIASPTFTCMSRATSNTRHLSAALFFSQLWLLLLFWCVQSLLPPPPPPSLICFLWTAAICGSLFACFPLHF